MRHDEPYEWTCRYGPEEGDQVTVYDIVPPVRLGIMMVDDADADRAWYSAVSFDFQTLVALYEPEEQA